MALRLFWFRRDLRINDNAGLHAALSTGDETQQVQPIFIFDKNILDRLKNPSDKRMPFIYDAVMELKGELNQSGADLWIFFGDPIDIFKELLNKNEVSGIFANHDYEPYARKRDQAIGKLAKEKGISFVTYKDQVIFERGEVLTEQQNPYTVYTPYKNKWLKSLSPFYLKPYPVDKYLNRLSRLKLKSDITLEGLGFQRPSIQYPPARFQSELIRHYDKKRDFPALENTSRLGLHLRFGTMSVRELARLAKASSAVWLSELIWREFFMQILYHFPHVAKTSFRAEYEKVAWRENKTEFERWKNGMTGFPIVDAGMRELNETGYMHNRVRMITASFLTKHLLMHWSLGERYFARELLDYDLALNNGNWQWAAGTGCDAAPYFRIFNPEAQTKRFDPDFFYIKKWVPEFGTSKYPSPMVDHKEARERALRAFAKALKK